MTIHVACTALNQLSYKPGNNWDGWDGIRGWARSGNFPRKELTLTWWASIYYEMSVQLTTHSMTQLGVLI